METLPKKVNQSLVKEMTDDGVVHQPNVDETVVTSKPTKKQKTVNKQTPKLNVNNTNSIKNDQDDQSSKLINKDKKKNTEKKVKSANSNSHHTHKKLDKTKHSTSSDHVHKKPHKEKLPAKDKVNKDKDHKDEPKKQTDKIQQKIEFLKPTKIDEPKFRIKKSQDK